MINRKRKILWATIEDYAGLWEILWEFTKESDQISEAEIKKVVMQLVADGSIDVFTCKEPYGEMEKIESQQREILSAEESWRPPTEGGISIRASATEKGKSYYALLSMSDSPTKEDNRQ